MKITEFEHELAMHSLMLVDFWADWCEPCKMLDVILEDLQKSLPDLYILKVDTDLSGGLKEHFSIMSVPVLMLFNEGQLLWRMNGFMMAGDLEKVIRELA